MSELCPISKKSSGRRPISQIPDKQSRKPSTTAEQVENSGEKLEHGETLVQLLWRAAAPGLKPLRLPRARGCAVSSNILAPGCPKLSTIDATAKTILERLYLVSGLTQFMPRVNNCPCAPTVTLPPLTRRQFLDFRVFFFRVSSGPSLAIFWSARFAK